MTVIYAHSLPTEDHRGWEPLPDHLTCVATTCAAFAAVFGWGELARAAGLLHDIGKCSPAFQTYIDASADAGARRRHGPDHSSAGAIEADRLFGKDFGRMLAFVIAGHHAGLADGAKLRARLITSPDAYDGWEQQTGSLPQLAALAPTRRFGRSADKGFTQAFLIRMLFSCLVDADRVETAAFYAKADGTFGPPVDGTPLTVLRDRLRVAMAAKAAAARANAQTDTERRLAALRADILRHACERSAMPPGLFTLTVPTGGGKTLASLSFALDHAVRHDLRRIVYIIPFTSVIEQTAGVFREALGQPSAPNEEDILEHHSNFDWDAALPPDREMGAGTSPAERLQRAAENWDVPIVVTTAVQFFESLFASKTSACRKLHNLANSVIVLDEAQTLPLHVLRPCLAALAELAQNYGASIVVCTATQPAWPKYTGALLERRANGTAGRNFGLDIPRDRELTPDPVALFTALNRATVDRRMDPVDDATIAARFAEQPQMLCIVNSRRHAKVLFDKIQNFPDAIHLSTWMCPRHRRLVLEHARVDLKAGRPVRIVATSLIEAGVDIDLPEVWRAAAGLDNILQAAGRCNREFRLAAGRLVIFEPAEAKAPHDLQQAWQAGRAVLREHADPQTLAAIEMYFRELYFNRGGLHDEGAALDASKIGDRPYPILANIYERADRSDFPFETIAKAFRLIDDTMVSVVVPWSSGPGDDEAQRLLAEIAAKEKPSRRDFRRLQQYTVSIPERTRDRWLALKVLRPVRADLGDAILCFDDLALYDERSGLRVSEPELRSADSNVIGDHA